MKKPRFHYEKMSKAELLTHVTAYADAIHDLTSRCMAAEERLRLIERTRAMFNNIPKEVGS